MTLTFSPTNLHLLIKTTLITIFMPESSKLSMKSYVIAFSHIWSCRKKVKFNPRSSMNNLGSTQVSYATYQVPRPSVNWFWKRRFLKFFTLYGHIGHLGHVTLLNCINFPSYSPIRFHKKFGSKWLNSFKENQGLTLKSEWPLAKVK